MARGGSVDPVLLGNGALGRRSYKSVVLGLNAGTLSGVDQVAEQSVIIGMNAQGTQVRPNGLQVEAGAVVVLGSGYSALDAPRATKTGAIAIGTGCLNSLGTPATGPRASGTGAIAIGSGSGSSNSGAQATGVSSVSLGMQSAATSSNTSALGPNTIAGGTAAIAAGSAASAAGSGSVAVGNTASAATAQAVALGAFARAMTSTQTIAIGGGVSTTASPQSTAQGGIAIGASNQTAVAGARATGTSGIAIGSGDASVAGASASAADAIAIGRTAVASHATSVALGKSATTTATNQIRLGTATEDVNIPGTLTLSGGSVTPAAWPAYTPTLTQSGAVTKTVTYAKYATTGKEVVLNLNLAVTGAGTGANAVAVGLPVAAASGQVVVGCGYIYDVSTDSVFKATVEIVTSTTVVFRPTTTTANDFLGVAVFTAALAAGDLISCSLVYEAA